MTDLVALFADVVGPTHLLTGDAISEDYGHDEALTMPPQRPAYLAKPATADEVAALLRTSTEHGVPVTARGSGCGLSGAAQPVAPSGERRGTLADTLHAIADVYRRHVEARTGVLRNLLPSIMIIITAALLTGLFIVALVMPMVRLMEGLSK